MDVGISKFAATSVLSVSAATQGAIRRVGFSDLRLTPVAFKFIPGSHLIAKGNRPAHMTVGKEHGPRAQAATITMYKTERTGDWS